MFPASAKMFSDLAKANLSSLLFPDLKVGLLKAIISNMKSVSLLQSLLHLLSGQLLRVRTSGAYDF